MALGFEFFEKFKDKFGQTFNITDGKLDQFLGMEVIRDRVKRTITITQERYIEKGSTINLTCIIQAGPLNLNPSFVFWNYNGKIITYDRERGGTVVISDRFEPTEFLPDFRLCVVTFLSKPTHFPSQYPDQ